MFSGECYDIFPEHLWWVHVLSPSFYLQYVRHVNTGVVRTLKTFTMESFATVDNV